MVAGSLKFGCAVADLVNADWRPRRPVRNDKARPSTRYPRQPSVTNRCWPASLETPLEIGELEVKSLRILREHIEHEEERLESLEERFKVAQLSERSRFHCI